ncbi:MAG: S41 family peptidase [Phycisphaerales bacterium]
MAMNRWIGVGSMAAVMALAGMATAQAPAAPAMEAVRLELSPDWSARVWEAAAKGDTDALLKLLEAAPADERLAQNVALLKANLAARETKRQEQTAKVSAELDKILASGGGDISLSLALKSAIELHMLSTDKGTVQKDPRVVRLVGDAESAAKAAAERGDWLTASDLFSRLSMLFEEEGRFKDDIKREMQRLAMIRLYAPERFWHLRNNRRNAEIAWKQAHKDVVAEIEDERTGRSAADIKARKEAETRPLPRYNDMGDSFQEKLAGIEETMVQNAVARAYGRHVERKSMDKILAGAIDSVRTLVTTDDLRPIFPSLADDRAREDFLGYLATEESRLEKAGENAGAGDLVLLIRRMVERSDKTVKLPRYALLHEFGNGAMLALDEFSAIIWPDEIRRFNRNTQGKFIGVGIQIELDPLWNIRVVTPLDSTPAQRAGVRSGDLIRKVDGKSTEGFTLDQAVDVITGPADTEVVLTVERGDEAQKAELEFPLTRQQIDVITVKGWKRDGAREDAWNWFIDPESKIGYIRVTQFAERTDAELDRAIDQLRQAGAAGVILDLRFNPGGLLEQAVAVVSRFVDGASAQRHNNGLVVTTHDKDNQLVQKEAVLKGKARLRNVPVVVLINEGSASASEIVSGALQDYAKTGEVRAVVLGARSYGKGSVQNVWPMEHRAQMAAVKVTTQYYLLPAGRKIHRVPAAPEWGVDPDLKVEMLPMQVTDAAQLRLNADVLRLGEPHAMAAGAEPTANPEDLITKGMDLQLHTALVILQAQARGKADTAMIEKRTANN